VLLLFQERRKQEREEEDKRMAEQRAADDARRKAEEVSKLHTPKKTRQQRNTKLQIATTLATYFSKSTSNYTLCSKCLEQCLQTSTKFTKYFVISLLLLVKI